MISQTVAPTPERDAKLLFIIIVLQINNAVCTNVTLNLWILLDVHTEACMTHMNCDATFGAISLWVKVIDCTGGIITTLDGFSGFRIFCFSNTIMYF